MPFESPALSSRLFLFSIYSAWEGWQLERLAMTDRGSNGSKAGPSWTSQTSRCEECLEEIIGYGVGKRNEGTSSATGGVRLGGKSRLVQWQDALTGSVPAYTAAHSREDADT